MYFTSDYQGLLSYQSDISAANHITVHNGFGDNISFCYDSTVFYKAGSNITLSLYNTFSHSLEAFSQYNIPLCNDSCSFNNTPDLYRSAGSYLKAGQYVTMYNNIPNKVNISGRGINIASYFMNAVYMYFSA